MNNKTAILIFANSAEKEILSKSFLNRNLFDALNAQSITIAKKTGLPYFHYSETEQIGNSFGERFTNAIESIYNKGFDAIITIGNDTPHLTSNHILTTVKKLQKHDLVLGPSTDGGFYLMGLKKAQFNKTFFLKLPWQTTTLNRSISKLTNANKAAICYLQLLTDIDAATDIKFVINSFKKLSLAIKTLLLQSLLITKNTITYYFIVFKTFILNHPFNKGSPAQLHL